MASIHEIETRILPAIEKVVGRPEHHQGTFTKYRGDWAGRVSVDNNSNDPIPKPGDYLTLVTKAGKRKESRITAILNQYKQDNDFTDFIVSVPLRSEYVDQVQFMIRELEQLVMRKQPRVAFESVVELGYTGKEAKALMPILLGRKDWKTAPEYVPPPGPRYHAR